MFQKLNREPSNECEMKKYNFFLSKLKNLFFLFYIYNLQTKDLFINLRILIN
jgi:hypothetical protein